MYGFIFRAFWQWSRHAWLTWVPVAADTVSEHPARLGYSSWLLVIPGWRVITPGGLCKAWPAAPAQFLFGSQEVQPELNDAIAAEPQSPLGVCRWLLVPMRTYPWAPHRHGCMALAEAAQRQNLDRWVPKSLEEGSRLKAEWVLMCCHSTVKGPSQACSSGIQHVDTFSNPKTTKKFFGLWRSVSVCWSHLTEHKLAMWEIAGV